MCCTCTTSVNIIKELSKIRGCPSIEDEDGTYMFGKLSLVSLLALTACGKSSDSGQDTGTQLTQEAHGKVAGIVVDTAGNPILGVSATAGDSAVITGADGVFIIPDVAPSAQLLVSFVKDGYAKNYSYVSLESFETVNTNITMLPITGEATVDSSQASEVSIEGSTLSFAANSFVTDSGETYSGNVRVQVTNLNPHTSDSVASPGDLSAVSFTNDDGASKSATTPSQLVSYGMVDVSLFGEDGEVLNVDEGSPTSVEISISNGDLPETYHLADGEEQVAWSFNPELGKWVEEDTGNIVERDGELFFQFEATHFSWWNCDQGFVPSCASGRVVDMLNFPVRGAEVICRGDQTTSKVTTDNQGYYVCDVMVGDNVTFGASTFVGGRTWGSSTSLFMDGEGSDSATCEPIPTIQIEVCRIAGSINVQNINSMTEEDVAALNGDAITAVFWEPPGDPEYCGNLWEDLNGCIAGSSDDIQNQFPESSIPGIPDEAQSVGAWLEVYNSAGLYRLERNYSEGLPVYINKGNQRPELEAGDVIDIVAPGDYDSYFGAWDINNALTMPEVAGFEIGGGVHIIDGVTSFDIEDSYETTVATAIVGNSINICRVENNRVSFDSSNLEAGIGGLGVTNIDEVFLEGPDGLPIRLQAFSGESVAIEVK